MLGARNVARSSYLPLVLKLLSDAGTLGHRMDARMLFCTFSVQCQRLSEDVVRRRVVFSLFIIPRATTLLRGISKPKA